MKISLPSDQKLINLDGNPDVELFGKEISLGQILAKWLIQTSSQDSVQRIEWAFELHAGRDIEVTPEQFGDIRKYVKEVGASDLAKGQILKSLNKQYEEQNKK